MDFGQALTELEAGQRISRAGWNGPGQYVEMQVPDEHSKMTVVYAYIRTAQGDLVPWLPSQGDMFADDWQVVAPEFRDGVPTSGLRGRAGTVAFPERG